MARHRRYGRRSHGGGPLGCLHAVIGAAAVAGLVVGAWHVATDPPAAPERPAVIVAAPRTASPTVEPTRRPSAIPSARPGRTARPDAPETVAQCLEGQGIDPYTVELEGTDPAEYGC